MARPKTTRTAGILIGEKVPETFGRLTPIGNRFKRGDNSIVVCECECGEIQAVYLCHLRSGATTSCGCVQKESASKANTTHGLRRSGAYSSWASMIGRCTNKNLKSYACYGARGITVCDRWLRSFENFYADMGPRPNGCSIDRKENCHGYSPENCRWATSFEQQNNKRNNLHLTINGITRTHGEWSAIYGVRTSQIWQRLRNGWNPKEAVMVPVKRRSEAVKP